MAVPLDAESNNNSISNENVLTLVFKSICLKSFALNTDFHSRYNRQSSTQIKRSRLSPRFYRKAMGLETVFVVFQLLSELGYELSF